MVRPAHVRCWLACTAQSRCSLGMVALQEKLWRLRAKRAWIREQLRALRGFPEGTQDASYAEPWAEAFGARSEPALLGVVSLPNARLV